MNTHIFYCIPLTFPDELDLCVQICSEFIKWYNGCFSCCLYSAPLSVYTILHDGKYFITDFCTEWNIIIVTWINRRWFIHFISYMWLKNFTFKYIPRYARILSLQKYAYYEYVQQLWFFLLLVVLPHLFLQVESDSPLHGGARTLEPSPATSNNIRPPWDIKQIQLRCFLFCWITFHLQKRHHNLYCKYWNDQIKVDEIVWGYRMGGRNCKYDFLKTEAMMEG